MQGDICQFLYTVDWDLAGEMLVNREWQEKLKPILVSEVAEIRTMHSNETQPLEEVIYFPDYYEWKLARRAETCKYIGQLIEQAYCKLMGEEICKCVRRDCVGGCDKDSIRKYGFSGNYSQYKVT